MRFRMPYATIDSPYEVTLEVKKSQFIGWCAAIDSVDDAQQLIALARERYPDASHHCSAYIAGPPGEDQAIGFADDGEPGGSFRWHQVSETPAAVSLQACPSC